MALTGQAKTDYQRDYMRRRRAKLAQSARLDSQPKSPLPDDEQAALLGRTKKWSSESRAWRASGTAPSKTLKLPSGVPSPRNLLDPTTLAAAPSALSDAMK